MEFYSYIQYDSMDCAPTCLKMVAKFYGREIPLDFLREKSYLTKEGVSLLSINTAAEAIGFDTVMANLSFDALKHRCPLPAIIHWNQNHFVVLYKITAKKITISDPAHGLIKLDVNTFLKSWKEGEEKGVVLLLEPGTTFYTQNVTVEKNNGLGFLFTYLKPYKRYIAQLIVGMLGASFISLCFPLLTQLLIDEGVNAKNIPFIYVVLLSQLFLFLGDTAIELIRNWLLLHINARISLTIISDFLIKLLKLPIKFFDTKAVGDLSQRINDHHRIESFLTSSVLSSVFSVLNIIIFASILAYYDWRIVITFLVLSVLSILWVFLFQKRRKNLDYKRFARNRENQDKLYEMITGMQEIKLYGNETAKRLEWEDLQVKYFKLNIQSLSLEQYQNAGYIFFLHLKNILITFIAAYSVIKGTMSLGALLSISYIIGQTNSPIEQLINFIKSAQDARLSMDRLQEIHNKEDEENKEPSGHIMDDSPDEILVNNLSFQYEGPHSAFVLNDISFKIPEGKVTAIVGTSGSGKSTLMKVLLGFYQPVSGNIIIGDENLRHLSAKSWRARCGVVMQDGYIFHDTIAQNIAMNGSQFDEAKVKEALKMANLQEFVDELPLNNATKIGASGIGLSGGQKQRILIARAVYKNPKFLFFDEATSSLDANNEKIIIENLHKFFNGKTVLIVAHRLSTVKNADQIIVLNKGRISEIGNHETLTRQKGEYFELIKNQLELGD